VLKLSEVLAPHRRLLQQEQEIRRLKQEVLALQNQNASMRSGMRRCVTCDYRIAYKNRQDQSVDDPP
jgi:hypothetical protein